MSPYPNLATPAYSTTLRTLDRDNGQSGLLFPTSRGWTFNIYTLVNNRVVWARGVPSRDMLIRAFLLTVITAASTNDNIEIAVLDASLHKLATTGVVAGKVNVAATAISIPLTTPFLLQAGTVYHAAMVSAVGGSAAAVAGVNYPHAHVAQVFGRANGVSDLGYQAASSPAIPSLCVSGGSVSGAPVLIASEV